MCVEGGGVCVCDGWWEGGSVCVCGRSVCVCVCVMGEESLL